MEKTPVRRGVEEWAPPLSGDMDIRIGADGIWYHESAPIRRPALVKLFAGILRRESDGEYYLVTPVEKWRIQVDDLPFIATEMECVDVGAEHPRLRFCTNIGESVVADRRHPLRVGESAEGMPLPAVALGRGLEARLSRSVFYRLVDMAVREPGADGECLVVYSGAERIVMGKAD